MTTVVGVVLALAVGYCAGAYVARYRWRRIVDTAYNALRAVQHSRYQSAQTLDCVRDAIVFVEENV